MTRKNNLPPCVVDQAKINLWVSYAFREVLGKAMYDCLLTHIVDYSTATPYIQGVVTTLNTNYSFEGGIYKCIQAIPTGEVYLPPHKDYWQSSPKFDSPCLELFWCDYLLPYLVYFISLREITPNQFQQTAEGYVKKLADNTSHISQEELISVGKYLRGVVDVALKNMDDYIRATYKDCVCLDKYKPLGVSCCSSCGETKCSCTNVSLDDGEYAWLVG